RALDDRGAQTRRHVTSTALRDAPRGFRVGAELGAAARARLDMRADRARFFRVERTERVRGEVVDRVSGHETPAPISRSRSLAMPRRTLVFTVPSGTLVRAAISLCESPDQNASASTSRCSGGSDATAARTRSAPS